MDEWPSKISPVDYIRRYPNGPMNQLARKIINRHRKRFNKYLDEYFDCANLVIRDLIIWLGKDLLSPDLPTLHHVVKDLLRQFHCSPVQGGADMYIVVSGDIRRKELLLRREIVKDFGVSLKVFGRLGERKKIPVSPDFWKLKLTPRAYLVKYGFDERGYNQNAFLAKAALAPFDSVIMDELKRVEKSISNKKKTFSNTIHANTIMPIAMELAVDAVMENRYDGNCSEENRDELKELIKQGSSLRSSMERYVKRLAKQVIVKERRYPFWNG